MRNQLHRLRAVTLAISLSLCWSGAQPGVTGETAASRHETKPLILESEYAKWRASLPDDYPQLADHRRMFWQSLEQSYHKRCRHAPISGSVHICDNRSQQFSCHACRPVTLRHVVINHQREIIPG